MIAPPTFAIVLSLPAGQVIADPELGLDYTRVVHGEQRFVHDRPSGPATGWPSVTVETSGPPPATT